jgi:hypothetical protein
LKIQQLEKEREEKQKLNEKLEAEKEMMQRKVTNLKKSPIIENRPVSPNLITNQELNKSDILIVNKKNNVFDTDKDTDDELIYVKKFDSKKIYNKKNVIEDINSDLENQSVK